MTKLHKEMGKKPLMTQKKKETMLQKVYIAVQKLYTWKEFPHLKLFANASDMRMVFIIT